MGLFDFFKRKKKIEKKEKNETAEGQMEEEHAEGEADEEAIQEYEGTTFSFYFSRKNCENVAEMIYEEFQSEKADDFELEKALTTNSNEFEILLKGSGMLKVEIKDSYEENRQQIYGMHSFFTDNLENLKGWPHFFNNVSTQIKVSTYIAHITVLYLKGCNPGSYHEDKIYALAKKLNSLVLTGMILNDWNGKRLFDLVDYEVENEDFVCTVPRSGIDAYEISEDDRKLLKQYLSDLRKAVFRDKIIDDYSSFSWYMWLVSDGKNIVRDFLEALEDDIIKIYDKNGNYAEITEKTKKIIIELRNGISIYLNVRADRYALETSMLMAEYFSDVKIRDGFLKSMILKQLSGFDCVVIIEIFMPKEMISDKRGAAEKLRELSGKIGKVCGIHRAYFSMDMNELKTFDGKLFISKKSGTEMPKKFRPVITAKRIDNFEMTEEDEKRRERSIEKIRAENLPYIEKMHSNISEAKAAIPSKETIIRRAVAMLLTGVASELYYEKALDAKEVIESGMRIYNEKYQVKDVLSENEKYYLRFFGGTEKENTEYNWRYETSAMLLWALSLYNIPDLKTLCNVPEIGKFVRSENLKTLAEKSEIRLKEEIMDMLDYLYRLNWSAVEMRIHPERYEGENFPYNESIIHFRRLALEWLVQPEKSIEEVEVEMHT